MEQMDDVIKLMRAMAELPFDSMEVSTKDATVRVRRGAAGTAVAEALQAPPAGAAVSAGAGRADDDGGLVAVPSPIIGVFYAAPSPDDPPFVRVGDRVRAGQTLCIVEAMKLMNDIPSPVAGVVRKVLAADGGEVEVGQPLFLLEPSEE